MRRNSWVAIMNTKLNMYVHEDVECNKCKNLLDLVEVSREQKIRFLADGCCCNVLVRSHLWGTHPLRNGAPQVVLCTLVPHE